MSIPAPSSRRNPLGVAVLDFVAAAGPRPTAESGRGAEEQEFIDTLRRIVCETRLDELLHLYHAPTPGVRARVYGRFAD
jgi:hypothetical protein